MAVGLVNRPLRCLDWMVNVIKGIPVAMFILEASKSDILMGVMNLSKVLVVGSFPLILS